MIDQITVRDVRNINKLNIVKTLMANKDFSMNDISDANKISVMTVKNIIDDLLKKNVIVKRKTDSSMVGRKPAVLNISSNVGSVLTIDLTSKKLFYYIIYNVYMEKVEKRYFKCNVNKSYLDNLLSFIAMIKDDMAGLKLDGLLGIGIAVPGVYFEEEDRISNELIKELNSIRLKKLIAEQFSVDNIVIDHDVKMAAVAETTGVPNAESRDMYYVFIGEGVGGAFIMNGNIYSGCNEIAGDLGQFIVNCDGENESNLESIASLPAIINGIKKKKLASETEKGSNDLDFIEILKKYNEGDEVIVKHFEYVLKILARVFYNIVWLVNPGKIIIGSSYKEFSKIAADFCTEYNKRLLDNDMGISLNIQVSRYDENSALIGLFEMVVNQWVEKI